jgi:hypothetical protein
MRVSVIVLASLFLLAGCMSWRPVKPVPVTVVVERDRPLPAWATSPLVKPMPVDGTVGARVKSNAQRGNVIDLANCHRSLLARLSKGEAVTGKECD